MKKKFIAAALGMILTICIVALPIIGASADTTENLPDIDNNFRLYMIEKNEYFTIQPGQSTSFNIDMPKAVNTGVFYYEFFSTNANINGAVTLYNNGIIKADDIKKEGLYLYTGSMTVEESTTRFTINIDTPNDESVTNIFLSKCYYSDLVNGYINNETANTIKNLNNIYNNAIAESKYGVFAGATIISAKLNYNNWQPNNPTINFINNGISFQSLAKEFDEYCTENSIDELNFTITLSTIPFQWSNSGFFVNIAYGFQSMVVYDIDNNAYNVKIGNERNDFGYNLYAQYNNETITPTKSINKIIISYQSIDYCGNIYNPTGSVYNDGYVNGYNEGKNTGYIDGYTNGKTEGKSEGYQNGYNTGYSEGYDKASKDIGNFFGFIASIGEAPANMIQEMFNFEIMGVNVSTVIFALLTTALVVILLKKFT